MTSLPLICDWDDTLVYWQDGPEGEWIPGALGFLKFAKRQGWKIVVASARANFEQGAQQIREKLDSAGHPDIDVVAKPLGFAYIDNRAAEFRGSWSETRDKVRRLAKT